MTDRERSTTPSPAHERIAPDAPGDGREQHPPVLEAEEARQGQIIRRRPMTRVLFISLSLAVVAMIVAYLVVMT